MNRSMFVIFFCIFLIGCTSSNDDIETIKVIDALNEKNQLLQDRNDELESIIENYTKIDNNKPQTIEFVGEEIEVDFKPYMVAEWTDYLGFCKYIGEELPRIYPSIDSPKMNESTMWLPNEEEFIVEVIRHTASDWYLVRIPGCENYVFVKPDELVQLDEVDYPKIPELDIKIDNVSIGDKIESFTSSFSVNTILTGEYTSGLVYELYTNIRNRGYEIEGTISVDIFDRIVGMHIATDKYGLNSGFKVGDNADEVIGFYNAKYPRFISKNYESSENFLLYDIGNSYFLGFGLDTEVLTDESVIKVIVISGQY